MLKGGVIINTTANNFYFPNTIEILKEEMKHHFNISDNFSVENYSFDLMGEFILSNSQYFLSKKKVIWEYENKEYVFIKDVEYLSEEYFNNLILPFSNFTLNTLIKPDKNHMSTYITIFLSSSSINQNLINIIKKFKRRKSYSFGLRGYSNFRIILFNKTTKEFFYNKDSKDIIKFYKGVLK